MSPNLYRTPMYFTCTRSEPEEEGCTHDGGQGKVVYTSHSSIGARALHNICTLVTMTSKDEIKQALKLCNKILDTSVDTLKKCTDLINEMTALRDAAEALAEHLDDMQL
eukprot:scaffold6469_cov111-Skeletonema_menzelii.AAC.2